MPESKRNEHTRLQHRTDDLEKEHEALNRDRKPFDKKEHDEHAEDLAKHKSALADHRRRVPDLGPGSGT
jgi:hypothetical protein